MNNHGGSEFRERRESARVSVQTIAYDAGVHENTVRRYERGENISLASYRKMWQAMERCEEAQLTDDEKMQRLKEAAADLAYNTERDEG